MAIILIGYLSGDHLGYSNGRSKCNNLTYCIMIPLEPFMFTSNAEREIHPAPTYAIKLESPKPILIVKSWPFRAQQVTLRRK